MTKGDLITGAYSRGKISGITSKPTPPEEAKALDRLETLAAEWKEANICTGYAFEDTPNFNTPHNVPRAYWAAYSSNLMFWLLSDFGKPVPETLAREARKTFSRLQNATAIRSRQQYPRRMPRGRNQRRSGYGDQYYQPVAETPNTCETVRMIAGDISDQVEHFDSYLNLGEDIASYTLEATTGLTIQTQSLSTPDVLYRVKAEDPSGDEFNSTLRVKIVATTTTGRVETRVIYYQVTEVD